MSDQEAKTTSKGEAEADARSSNPSSDPSGDKMDNDASSKTTGERKKPQKLGSTGHRADKNPESTAKEQSSASSKERKTSHSRRASQSRGRQGRSRSAHSDADSAYRSEVSPKPKRKSDRNRNKNNDNIQRTQQMQSMTGGAGEKSPLETVTEADDALDQAGGLVQDTAQSAIQKPQEAVGGLVKGQGGKKASKKGDDGAVEKDGGGTDEQLRLRLDINLDIEVQLKAKIHGDLTLGLLN